MYSKNRKSRGTRATNSATRATARVAPTIHALRYRLWQVRQQLGSAPPLTAKERPEVASFLPASALPLFESMSNADQQHALRVCRGLQARGCSDEDMLAAALLHDVGKAGGRVPFWTRPVIVLGKRVAPRLLARLAVYPQGGADARGADAMNRVPTSAGQPRWRRSLGCAWWHAEIGADLAAQAGLSPRAVLYIRTHHQAQGPAAELHLVDEAS